MSHSRFRFYALLFVALLLLPAQLDAQTSIRQRSNFNQSWKFELGDFTGAQATTYNDTLWGTVGLPHSFSRPYFLWPQFYTGYGWYRKHFTVPASWSGDRVFFEFDGAFQDAQVYVNGQLIGEHLGGYTGFSYDVTSAIVSGDNVVAVRLNNSWNAQIAPRAGDHTFSGGLYRDVWLVVTNPLHVTWYGTFITTPQISTASGTVEAKTEIRNDNPTSQPCTVQTAIVDPNGNTVATISSTQTVPASSTVTFDQTTAAIANPMLWHPDHPYLYQALTTVYNGATSVDNYTTNFGFRWFSWTAEQGFFLNGQPYYLHGADAHQDHAGWGDGTTDNGLLRDVQLIKGAGLNFIRGSHYPKAPAFAAACDSVGVLFWSENCFWGLGGATGEGSWGSAGAFPNNASDQAAFQTNVTNTLTDMIRIHRNHPSIVAWSMCNEPFFTSSATITPMRTLLSTEVTLTHQLDPTRPAGIGGAQRPLDSTRIDILGDVAGYNGDGATEPLFQDPGIPNLVTEYGSVSAVRPGNYNPGWGLLALGANGLPVQYAWRSGQTVWCGFDHGSLGGTGLETMGIIDYFRLPKQAWYWYRNQYLGIAAPTSPASGTPAGLSLTADKTTLQAVDGTDDVQLIATVLDASGNALSNNVPITLTVVSGPGEFPTGPSITFTPPGSGAPSDISILNGKAAIEFRSYYSGTSVIQATAPGLASASITITSQGSPAYVPGVTLPNTAYAYSRYNGTITQAPLTSLLLALNRPTEASSTAPGSDPGFANDGNTSTMWQAADANPNAWWEVALELSYQINRVQITFPSAGNYQYCIDVSSDGTNWTTAVDQSQTTDTDQSRTAIGNFGNNVGFVRVRFTGLPAGHVAGLAEVVVGGGSGITFNTGQLGGTIIGTPGSWGNNPTTVKEAAMDGDLTTFFDGPDGSGDWVGLDLGTDFTAPISAVSYCPRPENGTSDFAARMVGGQFQGANQPNFSDAVTLFTITAQPTTATMTSQAIANNSPFRYVRYLSPTNGNCDVAEIQFYTNQNLLIPETLYAFENNANDSSGNGNNGTSSNITYGPGKVGSFAAQFNGTNSYVSSSFSTTNDFSVALWVKTNNGSSLGSSSSQWWSGRGLVDADIPGPALDWGTAIVNGSFAFGIGGNTNNADTTVLSSTPINNNAWHHVAATWSEATGAMTLYVDGVQSGAGTAGAGVPRVSPISIDIGRVASASGNVSLNGSIDDVRLYNRVLSASEVSALATSSTPTTPSSLTASAGNGKILLDWPASSGAEAYAVSRSTVSGSGYSLLTNTFTNSYLDTTALNGTTYYYVVAAENLFATSTNSPQAIGTPLGLPAAPSGFSTVSGNAQVSLTWSSSPTATSYNLLRSLVSGGPYSLINSVATTADTDTAVSNGTTYYYVVTATNAAGTSGYSSESSAQPMLPIAPTITNAPSPAAVIINSSYTFTFTASGYPAPTFKVTSGSLPPGLNLSSAGVLSGTPTAVGTFAVTITASNSVGSNSQNFSITVTTTPLVTDTPTMPTWGLMLLTVLLIFIVAKSLRTPGSAFSVSNPLAELHF